MRPARAQTPRFVKTGIAGGNLIDPQAARLAGRIMRLAGWSPDRVARITLAAHDKGRPYVLPQPDARLTCGTTTSGHAAHLADRLPDHQRTYRTTTPPACREFTAGPFGGPLLTAGR